MTIFSSPGHPACPPSPLARRHRPPACLVEFVPVLDQHPAARRSASLPGGTRSRVRYRLASPVRGSSSPSRRRIVTFGQTINTVSETECHRDPPACSGLTRQPASPRRVLLPVPVAIFSSGARTRVAFARRSSPDRRAGLSRPSGNPRVPRSGKMMVSTASSWAKEQTRDAAVAFHHAISSAVTRDMPGRSGRSPFRQAGADAADQRHLRQRPRLPAAPCTPARGSRYP